MANVTYDDGSFFIDGKRIWLVSGSVHYFRTPADLWRDRLLKAKRAGLNCISTYVAWNFHEPLEGQWRLSGDHDVEAFVRLAGELGLYVILRPGPYICAEWDFGGLPGWLSAKSGVALRTNNATYQHYFDKYFRKVLPPLAELQVTRGGNIILVQNENEYLMPTMPDRINYLGFINQLLKRSGFDVPIINCDMMTDPPAEGNIECVNAWSDAVQLLKQLRARQPHAPMLVTEFWNGWFDHWGGEHQRKDATEVARKAMEILGCGAQYNYYMWHGGTNFGFHGGKLVASHEAYQTTSYDYDAPLAEDGSLTEKYYTTRLVNMLANHMGQFFAASYMEEPPVSIHDNTDVLNLSGSMGRWAVVTNSGKKDVTEANISLPCGKELKICFSPLDAVAIPIDLQLTDELKLDYSNLTPLGFFWQKVLVLHGQAGWYGQISINGLETEVVVPADDEIATVEHDELVVVVINSQLAMRTWALNDTLVLGPKFVGENQDEVACDASLGQYAIISNEGKINRKKVKPEPRSKAAIPKLSSWSRVGVCPEPVAKNLEWQKIDHPKDVDHLGIHYGYVWYRMDIDEGRARTRWLYLPECADRATVFLNGDRIGIWGVGDGASRKPINAKFKKGKNVLTMLVDNLGRMCFGRKLGEQKGLFGHVHDAKVLRTSKFKLKESETFSKRIIPRNFSYLIEQMEQGPVFEAQTTIALTKVTPIHLSFTNLPCHVAVYCNDRAVAFVPNDHKDNFGSVIIGPELKTGKNVIKLVLWGQISARMLEYVKFHSLLDNVSQNAKISFRPWEMPREGLSTVGKDRPAWCRTTFKYTPREQSLFLRIVSSKKGQIFLNGHNIGRFWNVGPQQRYYLPPCWLAEDNELLLFCEQGRSPLNSRLELGPAV